VAERIELRFRRALARLVDRDATVLAAVSGGADSVALIHLLVRASPGLGLRLVVGHLDHGLRRGSKADRRFVESLAASLSLQCLSGREEVAAARRRDESPEEAARRVRRRFLLDAAERAGADRIATGHTLDDQAETIVMRLVRGAGATALAGMKAAGPGPFVRPLLELERSDVRRFLERREIAFRDDPSNRSLRFDRNRVRRLIVPQLRELLNARAPRNLVRAAERFAEDAVYLDELAADLFATGCQVDREGRVRLDAEALARAPRVLGRRVALLALRRSGADARRIGTRHIEALIELASGAGRGELHLPGRLGASRRGDRVVIGPRR